MAQLLLTETENPLRQQPWILRAGQGVPCHIAMAPEHRTLTLCDTQLVTLRRGQDREEAAYTYGAAELLHLLL